jgi:hypothetical protein
MPVDESTVPGAGPGSGGPGGDPGGGAGGRGSRSGRAGAVTAAAFVMLFLAGLAQAVIGTFYYGSGPAPLAAAGFDLLVLASCVLAGWGMRRAPAGLAVAAGWLITAFVLAMSTTGGSVLVTNTSAGAWFLFGGSIGAAAGALISFAAWSRPPAQRRAAALRRRSGWPGRS